MSRPLSKALLQPEEDACFSQTVNGFLPESSVARHSLLLHLRDAAKGRLLADRHMWSSVQACVHHATDQAWVVLEEEVERTLEASPQKRSNGLQASFSGIYHHLRRFVLFHYLPYNRSFFGKLKDPWFCIIFLATLLPIPGLRVALMSVILFLLLRPLPSDEFQLVNFILAFKGAQFIGSGLLSMALGAAQYFRCYRIQKDSVLQCMEAHGPSASTPVVQLLDYLGSWLLGSFAHHQLSRTRNDHEALFMEVGYRGSRGRSDRLWQLIRFDRFCFFTSLVLLAALEARKVRKAFLDVVEQEETPSLGDLRSLNHSHDFAADFYWCRVLYSLCSLPFLILVPLQRLLLTDAKPTGYNLNGECVPCCFLAAEEPLLTATLPLQQSVKEAIAEKAAAKPKPGLLGWTWETPASSPRRASSPEEDAYVPPERQMGFTPKTEKDAYVPPERQMGFTPKTEKELLFKTFGTDVSGAIDLQELQRGLNEFWGTDLAAVLGLRGTGQDAAVDVEALRQEAARLRAEVDELKDQKEQQRKRQQEARKALETSEEGIGNGVSHAASLREELEQPKVARLVSHEEAVQEMRREVQHFEERLRAGASSPTFVGADEASTQHLVAAPTVSPRMEESRQPLAAAATVSPRVEESTQPLAASPSVSPSVEESRQPLAPPSTVSPRIEESRQPLAPSPTVSPRVEESTQPLAPSSTVSPRLEESRQPLAPSPTVSPRVEESRQPSAASPRASPRMEVSEQPEVDQQQGFSTAQTPPATRLPSAAVQRLEPERKAARLEPLSPLAIVLHESSPSGASPASAGEDGSPVPPGGLRVAAAIVRGQEGSIGLQLMVGNFSNRAMADWKLWINKNPFGLSPALPLELPEVVAGGGSAQTVLPLLVDQEGWLSGQAPEQPLQMEVALGSSAGIFYFSVTYDLSAVLQASGPLEKDAFQQHWMQIPEEQKLRAAGVLKNLRQQVKPEMLMERAKQYFLYTVAHVQHPQADVLYLSARTSNDLVVLCELALLSCGSRLQVVYCSVTAPLLPLFQGFLADLFCVEWMD